MTTSVPSNKNWIQGISPVIFRSLGSLALCLPMLAILPAPVAWTQNPDAGESWSSGLRSDVRRSDLEQSAATHNPQEESEATQEGDAEAWIQLFNGQNLEGWTPKVRGEELGANYLDTFRVEDGLLKVRFDKYDNFDTRFGHLFYKEPFENYVLRVEYRFVGEQCPGGPGWAFRNSGMMLHCQDPETMQRDQNFPVSIEVQLLGGNGTDKRPTLNLCTPGTNVVYNDKLHKQHCTQSASETYHGDQWVTVEVEVRGGEKFIHRIDGQTVLEYTEPQYDPNDADASKLIKDDQLIIDGGYISLQSESHPIDFRKIELKVLK